jgi:hypothetical protein
LLSAHQESVERDYLHLLIEWIVLSVVVWAASTSIARARVLRPLRAWVKRRSDYLAEGVSCQYCVSHWVAFAATLLFRPQLLPAASWPASLPWLLPIADFFACAFALIGLAALIARNLGKTPPDGIHPDQKEWSRLREEVLHIAPEMEPVIQIAEENIKE